MISLPAPMLAVAVACLAVTPALSSAPIRTPIAGCAIEGVFITSSGHELKPRQPDGDMLDLTAFEGRALSLEGWLHPGDRYDVTAGPRIEGPCPDAIRQHAVRVLPWAFFRQSKERYEAGDIEGALATIDRALAIDPELCAYGWRARVRDVAGQTAEAILDATHASEQAACREIDREAARVLLERLQRASPPPQ